MVAYSPMPYIKGYRPPRTELTLEITVERNGETKHTIVDLSLFHYNHPTQVLPPRIVVKPRKGYAINAQGRTPFYDLILSPLQLVCYTYGESWSIITMHEYIPSPVL